MRSNVEPTLLLVSACLLGAPVAYDGGGRCLEELLPFGARGRVIPVCPEVAGGLPIPRPSAEIVGGSGADVLGGRARIVAVDGADVTESYLRGAEIALAVAERHGCTVALLRERSPSCGVHRIYNGTHSHRQKPGEGVTTALLRQNGVRVYSDRELEGASIRALFRK